MVESGTTGTAERLTQRDEVYGHRLASAMFGLAKQQASVAARMSRAGGVDRSAVLLLKTLAASGPARVSALAAAVHSDPSTVSRQIAALVRDGLVERTADQADGRASLLAATPAGLALLGEQRRRMGLALARVVRDWPEEDRVRFIELLERFVADHEQRLPVLIHECTAERAHTEGES